MADLWEELAKARRLLAQKRSDCGKLYSLLEPHVECIAKGKAHKRCEFGCKVGFEASAWSNWILGARAFHGAPYDSHTPRTVRVPHGHGAPRQATREWKRCSAIEPVSAT